jgi:hypothetical protein
LYVVRVNGTATAESGGTYGGGTVTVTCTNTTDILLNGSCNVANAEQGLTPGLYMMSYPGTNSWNCSLTNGSSTSIAFSGIATCISVQ